MTLAPGARLGPYEILAPLGRGGMGEVHRARDSRLGRDVAIKALSDAFALDPGRVARFEREAKLLASMNHPNIGAIYGLEEQDGRRYLVLELVDGETLAARIHQGRLPLDEAIAIASQIAGAVEAAHEAGVIHRDLKPANVMVRPDGSVKVLDFGLGATPGPGGTGAGDSDPSLSPTETGALTAAGVLLGTAAYMSPEQARGKSVDRRTDSWSFGCVLYEMLVRKRAFEGETASDLLAAVLRAEPDWSRLPAETPQRVRRLIQRCLQKDPKLRLRDLGDARLELVDSAEGDGATIPTAKRRRWIGLLGWALAAVALAALVAGWRAGVRLFPQPTLAGPQMLLSLPLDPGLSLGTVSPDGKRLACFRESEGRRSLVVLDLGDGSRSDFPGVTSLHTMFWSPDGRELAVLLPGGLDALNVSTGLVRRICSFESVLRSRGSWSTNGTILVANNGRLFRVASSGGTPEPVAEPDSAGEELGVNSPLFLPDGNRFLISRRNRDGGGGSHGIEVRSLDGGRPTRIEGTEGIGGFKFEQDHLIYNKDFALIAQRLDFERARLVGEPTRLVNASVGNFTVSRNGTLLYVPREESPGTLRWLDRTGRNLGEVGESRPIRNVALAPDGIHALVARGTSGLSLVDLERGVATELSAKGEHDGYPVWSRDGRWIYYSRPGADGLDVWRRPLGGTEPPQRLIGVGGKVLFPDDLAPDDSILVAHTTEGEIYVVHLEATPRAELYARLGDRVSGLRFSPDGRWLLYESHESGRAEVYVNSLPRPGTPQRISADGGAQPHWRADGREIVYVGLDSMMMSAECTLGTSPRFGRARPLFRAPFDPETDEVHQFDMTPDAQRFLMIAEDARPPTQEVKVLVNWQARLGTGR